MKKKILLSILTSTILVAQEVELSPITVTSAIQSSQSIEDVTSNVNVITAKEIEERHYTTVTEALNTVSGINFTSNGGLGKTTDIYLRGFDSKRVLVLIDGIRYNDVTSTNGAPFGDLMIGDIQQIEVIKGAQSGVWGADATAGVINIITKDAKSGLRGSANAEFGSFQTKKYGALSSYKEDSYYIKAGVQKLSMDGFSAKAPLGDDIDLYEDDAYTNTTSNIKFGFNLDDNNKVDLSHTIIDAKSDYDSSSPDDTKFMKTKDSFSQINYNNKNSFTELDIYAKLSKFERDYSVGSEFDGNSYEYGIKSNTPYGDNDFLILGADYKTFEHKNAIQKKYDNNSLFMTNSNEFNILEGRTIITESLRFDDYDQFDDKTTGKLGVKHFCNTLEGASLSANVGSSYNVPTLTNLYHPTWGNPNIKPESTLSYDIGAQYKDLKLTYFKSTTQDMIEYDFGTSSYNNIEGDVEIQGIEVEYNSKLNDDFSMTSNYSWLDARNSDDEVLRRRPKNTINLALDYYGVKNLHVGINGEYIGERYSNNNESGTQTGKYTVVNLVTNYSLNKNLSIYAKIENLFDKYYQVLDGYATAPLSAYAGIKAQF